jgi:hypothetical protein
MIDNERHITQLREARKLIERGWTRRTNARDSKGNPCAPESTRACRWCLAGALLAAGVRLYRTENLACLSLTFWNDNRATKKLALACLDNSIAALEAEAVPSGFSSKEKA